MLDSETFFSCSVRMILLNGIERRRVKILAARNRSELVSAAGLARFQRFSSSRRAGPGLRPASRFAVDAICRQRHLFAINPLDQFQIECLEPLAGANVQAGHQDFVNSFVELIAGLLALIVFEIEFALAEMIVCPLDHLIDARFLLLDLGLEFRVRTNQLVPGPGLLLG